MRALALCVALALCGCAAKGPVYLQRPCNEAEPARPTMPTADLLPVTTLFDWAKSAIAEIDLREAYEIELATALRNCVRIGATVGKGS